MLNTLSTMSLQKPSFKSNLPDYLLQDASPKERYILENLNVIGQVNHWLIEETTKQNDKLESVENMVTEVDSKLKFTNGKIANSILQIQALESKNEADKETDGEIKKIVSMKLFAQKYLLNKYILIGAGIFCVGVIKVVTNDELRGIVMKIAGF